MKIGRKMASALKNSQHTFVEERLKQNPIELILYRIEKSYNKISTILYMLKER